MDGVNGYGNENHLGTAVKKYRGQSPLDYREKGLEKNNNRGKLEKTEKPSEVRQADLSDKAKAEAEGSRLNYSI